MRLRFVFLSSIAAAILAPTAAFAQTYAATQGTTILHFTCNVGSFRFVNGIGKVDMDFKGTVLVTDLKGTIKPSGNIKLEYDSRGRKAYFGAGHIVVQGEFRQLQWFGQDLQGSWDGRGRALLYGEYDKNLDTGFFWFLNETDRKRPWLTGGYTVDVPLQTNLQDKPIIRGGGGKK